MQYILNYIFTEPIGFIVLLIIIFFQIRSFIRNEARMRTFRNIFSKESEWNVSKHWETNLVNGISAEGNEVFNRIVDSINQYLKNNSGSVIDFGLLRDSVDRHCDMVENEIATQTPVPLYLGLVGTMSGVIIGLFNMLRSGAIFTLMSSSTQDIMMASNDAAGGINSLLGGIGFAMFASVLGIILTTWSSSNFKTCKVEEEQGKNTFLAWMQSTLLPELPTDTSDALNDLVVNLNRFNSTFAGNTQNLGKVLSQVNEVYKSQQKIFEFVHDMDMMQSAKANVVVLRQLEKTTGHLQEFNQYLMDIKGYTDAIHRFEQQFNEEADRVHVLEEIRDFFRQHNAVIAKTTADADNALQGALQSVKDNTTANVNELHKQFVAQSETFKQLLKDERDTFHKFATELQTKFQGQLSQMPQLAKQLEKVAAIPENLNKVAERMEQANAKLVKDIAAAMTKQAAASAGTVRLQAASEGESKAASSPVWMKFTAWVAVMLIAIVGTFSMWSNYQMQQRMEVLTQQNEDFMNAAVLAAETAKGESTAKVQPDTVAAPIQEAQPAQQSAPAPKNKKKKS